MPVVLFVVGALGCVTEKRGRSIKIVGDQGKNWTVAENNAIENGQNYKEGA